MGKPKTKQGKINALIKRESLNLSTKEGFIGEKLTVFGKIKDAQKFLDNLNPNIKCLGSRIDENKAVIWLDISDELIYTHDLDESKRK